MLACAAAAHGQRRTDGDAAYRQYSMPSDPVQLQWFLATGSTLGPRSVTLSGAPGNSGGASGAAGSTVSVDTLKIPAAAIKEMREFQKKFDEGNLEDAAKRGEKVLKISPQWAAAHQDLGQCYARMRLYDKAIVEFQNAAALDTKMAAAWVSMAGAYFLQGQFHDGENAARRALEIDPANQTATYFLGRTLAAQEHDLPAAMDLLHKSENEFPASYLVLANLYLRQNLTDQAVTELRGYLGQPSLPEKDKVACMVERLTHPHDPATCAMR
jgi:tetratricopeptide (TPR) repeat protein